MVHVPHYIVSFFCGAKANESVGVRSYEILSEREKEREREREKVWKRCFDVIRLDKHQESFGHRQS